MTTRVTLSAPLAWQRVREARRELAVALEGYSRELRDATIMTASELLENAVKYGEAVPGAADARLVLDVDDRRVIIEVSNGTTSTPMLQELRQCIERIQHTIDKSELYVSRLQALLDDPVLPPNLGLYRIAFEGGFDLKYTYRDHVITVTATRACG